MIVKEARKYIMLASMGEGNIQIEKAVLSPDNDLTTADMDITANNDQILINGKSGMTIGLSTATTVDNVTTYSTGITLELIEPTIDTEPYIDVNVYLVGDTNDTDGSIKIGSISLIGTYTPNSGTAVDFLFSRVVFPVFTKSANSDYKFNYKIYM